MVEVWPRRNQSACLQSRAYALLPGMQASLRPFYIACWRKAGQFRELTWRCRKRSPLQGVEFLHINRRDAIAILEELDEFKSPENFGSCIRGAAVNNLG